MAQHLRIRRPNGRLSRRITRWLAPLLVAMSSIWFLPWRAADAATPSVSISAANELIFGAGVTSDRFTSAGSGFTARVITSPDSDIVLDKTVSSLGSYNVTADQVGNWVLQMVTLRAAAGTPPP